VKIGVPCARLALGKVERTLIFTNLHSLRQTVGRSTSPP
jgi:hypothetical protein